jgi:Zn-dependent protease with chaperone function
MRKSFALACFFVLFWSFASTAQGVGSQRQPGPTAEQSTQPSQERNREKVEVPEPSPEAVAYYHSGNVLWFANLIWALLVPAVWSFAGFSARLRNAAARIGRKWFFILAVYFAVFTIINFVIDLPLDYYEGYVRQHAYGLSNQALAKWFSDSITSLIIALVGGVLVLWVPYLLLKKSPRRWWLYTGLLSVPFLSFLIFAQPIWIDPLFNKFGPMKDKALEAKILALAERAGIEGGRVYEVAKSEDTKALNAYVAGFGNTKRIVLWDTTIAKLNENELLFVMGHEMGHYVLGHTWKYVFFFSALIMVTLFVIHRTAGWLMARYRHRFGFDRLSDIASLPLIILLFGAFIFIVSPAALAFTRHFEHEADRFGLEITRDNHSAATAFVKLQSENLGIPRPGLLYKLWRESHPPLGERIDFCNEYRPWEKDERLRYGDLFREAR